jgi:triosephosphate isomerase
MRRLVLVGNWKMHTTPSTAYRLALDMRKQFEGIKDADIGFCPPATSIWRVAEALKGSVISWGAQNAHWEDEGAFTGELSVKALLEMGCTYVILGHSERRHIFGESDEMIARRLESVMDSELTPILCVGETENEKSEGRMKDVLARQLDSALKGLKTPPALIAYEPVWAIGTGKRAGIKDMEAAHRFLREKIKARFGDQASSVRIMYGGSLKPDNVAELAVSEEFDGGLVGGASLSAEKFATLVFEAIKRRKS